MPFQEGPFAFDGLNEVSGVYGIANSAHGIIYVGQSENLKRRMQEHVADKAHCMWKHSPSVVFAEVVYGEAGRRRREFQLILEFDPPCNGS